MGNWKLSIDTGGTFTDCLCESPDGILHRLKILSNSTLRGRITGNPAPDTIEIDVSWTFDPYLLQGYSLTFSPEGNIYEIKEARKNIIILSSAIEEPTGDSFEINSKEEVPVFAARLLTRSTLSDPLPPMEMRLGTTKGTNALLERKGSRVAFITTCGFKDLLAIGNQQRPDLFALNVIKNPLFYDVSLEVRERTDASGNIHIPLTKKECERVLKEIKALNDPEVSIAISFLHSTKNNTHEVLLKNALQTAGFSRVSCSSELSSASKVLPRAETTVVNSYLAPLMQSYLSGIQQFVPGSLQVMTSAGHLTSIHRFFPKDSLLSGPAGGIKGAARIGRQAGIDKLVTFDMGGTSTDISIYDQGEDYAYETQVGGAFIQAPCLAIDTIAAGGGSICTYNGQILDVGPQSAGAYPGPACYGSNGPLTVTDINFLAGRIIEDNFSIPVKRSFSEKELSKISLQLSHTIEPASSESLIRALLQITTEKMAKAIRKMAIRKGTDLTGFTLITFGGAGGQHACDLAEQLAISDILVPYDAGLLSAYGINTTEVAHFEEMEILQDWETAKVHCSTWLHQLYSKGTGYLRKEGHSPEHFYLKDALLYLRFHGQESTIEIKYSAETDVLKEFKKSYTHLYGHWLENKSLELTSLKVLVAVEGPAMEPFTVPDTIHSSEASKTQPMLEEKNVVSASVFVWEDLSPGAYIEGPAIVASNNCTLVLKTGWSLTMDSGLNARISGKGSTLGGLLDTASANLTLFTNRFAAVVEEMGTILQRTSFSVNVKERVDFSCALLDHKGRLVVNAPHIPVHLGSMGLCVRAVKDYITMEEGDVIVTNHPAFGGSHLPDITLISPVFSAGQLIGYVANRAHHAEIGGKTPGSMPPDAKTLKEEGIVISPMYLLKAGIAQWDEIQEKLQSGPYPSRSPNENIADLRGALASIQSGIRGVQRLCELYGSQTTMQFMDTLYSYAGDQARDSIFRLQKKRYSAIETLDDGSPLCVYISRVKNSLKFDFTGSSPLHPGNLNATPAIVRSVILYVVRLLIKENLPLNEGILRDIRIHLPHGLLHPDFEHLSEMPSVVGGNTEVSQRLTDTLLKALELAACSYGTMNNIIFGNSTFGFYETVCGGTGAGQGFNGCDAVHQHMTNTRITDPEIIELRYPVRLEEFSIRVDSAGKGQWTGGNGVIRKIRFLENVELSVLTQHRTIAPYGLHGGELGKPGRQWVEREGQHIKLGSSDFISCKENDLFIMETPGGGGYGVKPE